MIMAEDFPRLNTEVDTSLKDLDFDQIRQERFDRNRHFLESVNPTAAAKVFPGHEHEGRQLSKASQAAITIQRFWRGFKGREAYVSALWEKFEQEEEKQHEKMLYQMEEGELLVENRQLEVLLDDGKTTRRNAERRYLSKVITIQRAWRSYLEKPASERSRREPRYHGDHQDDLRSDRVKVNRSNPFGNSAGEDEEQGIETESSGSFMFNPLTENENSSINSTNKSPLINNFFKSSTSKNNEESLNIHELSPKQQRKHSLLSKAHEFAELKKLDSKVLPFDLHLHLAEGESSEPLPEATKGSNMSTNMPPSVNSDQNGVTSPADSGKKELKESMKDYSETNVKGDNCVEIVNKTEKGSHPVQNTKSGADNSSNCDKYGNSNSQSICDNKGVNFSENNSSCDTKGDNSCHTIEIQKSDVKGSNSGKKDAVETESAFDVYNIETTLPDMDWSSLEQKLKAASEEARLIQEARRNDREEIRKKLAMGGEDGLDDDDDDDDEITYKKPNIQSRLQSGLQICFMNESPGDTDNEGLSPRQHEIHDNVKLMKKVSNLVDSDNNLSTVTDLNNPTQPTTSIQRCSPPRLKPGDEKEKSEDFHSRQEQLQNEAKMALAQAGSMAYMQLEIEKQLKKKSPMAEMVNLCYFTEYLYLHILEFISKGYLKHNLEY
ncbi:IQCJ-SCHIP1 readthrough transcript protein-like isoform X2 [Ruditapes philippinarum]|uniref:IQCJ-SCHIP1 readthrough transcript protein-like isoform X2 n=1 Tax=Ruditapes philippinarum TaxID=129788 RepID=UPI00295B7509|nr:IQCJ-SCHIP1 readthrough transcript protein-like isoform X2 [Ruditapes philippinarum]